jgi:hypothetical protein
MDHHAVGRWFGRGWLVIALLTMLGTVVLDSLLGDGGIKAARQLEPCRVDAYLTATDARPARIGQTVTLDGWQVTLLDFGPAEFYGRGTAPALSAQPYSVVADLRLRNLEGAPKTFRSQDFLLRSQDGRVFHPVGQAFRLEWGFVPGQTVPPGQITASHVAFDIEPGAEASSLTVLNLTYCLEDRE